jgi:CBS domain-containing protein
MLVGEVLRAQQPVTLKDTATVRDAAQAMREHHVGDVLLLDANNALVGIVTDRDIVVRGLAEGRDPARMKATDVCSATVVTIDPVAGTEEAEKLMRAHAIRRLPVVSRDGRIHGVVSLGDLAGDVEPGSALADIAHAPPNL